jgi:SAM-dependent methyltransferase
MEKTREQGNAVDSAKLDAFFSRAFADIAAGYGGVMVSVGHRVGLYKAMAGAGPLTARDVAKRSGCAERYVREWLGSQVAAGYVDYHVDSETYELTPEQAAVLADEDSPLFLPTAWNVPASMWLDEEKTIEAFRTGGGVAWGEHHRRLHHGVAAFYRNGYRASLVQHWLPALDGVIAKLEAGALVADVGCGHGHSTMLMAQAFPRSRFRGFDVHADSIDAAQAHAAEARVTNTEFESARADAYPGKGYDLICFFDCLHDMGDPTSALEHAANALAPGGTVMLVEPYAGDRLDGQPSLVARIYYSASSAICCAHAISEGGRLVLGAQAGEARLAELLRKTGFSHVRRAAETPFNLIIEVRR